MNFTSMQLGPEFADALNSNRYSDEADRLFKVGPPKNNSGIDASINLLRSFHEYHSENRFLKTKNISDSTGFEVWYDDGELQFLYYTPDKERENHFRKQIDGHFRGSRIEKKTNTFPTVEPGLHITGGEVWLNNHYFEPIRDKSSDDWNDPYLSLFSEIHTRDDTETIFQILFQPAEPNWTRSAFNSIDDHAEYLKGDKDNSRFFGLLPGKREATNEEEEFASKVLRQSGYPAYYVNIRYLTIAPDAYEAARHAESIASRLELSYQSVAGQTLKTHSADSNEEVAELIRKVAAREGTNMGLPRGWIPDWKREQFGDPTKYMIMTLTELAGLMHFPKSSEVDLPAIEWTNIPVEGSLPHNAKRFKRLTHSERLKQLKRWESAQEEFREKYNISEEDTKLKLGNPKDEYQHLRKKFEQLDGSHGDTQ